MKATISEDCIGCGLCEATCDAVFHIGDEGTAEAIEGDIPAEYEEDAQTAADDCPVSAITVE